MLVFPAIAFFQNSNLSKQAPTSSIQAFLKQSAQNTKGTFQKSQQQPNIGKTTKTRKPAETMFNIDALLQESAVFRTVCAGSQDRCAFEV